MKKLFLLSLLSLICITLHAQRTFSYKMTSSYCPQTGAMNSPMGVAIVTIDDDYVTFNNKKFRYYQRNMDGSSTYLPTDNSGMGFYQVDALLVSQNLQAIEERVTSSVGNMSLNMINTYGLVAEDDGQYAMTYGQAYTESKRGGRSNGGNNNRSTCSICGDTGVDPSYLEYWGGRANWLGYYNQNGNKCPYCGRYSTHYHSKCSHCNVPRY